MLFRQDFGLLLGEAVFGQVFDEFVGVKLNGLIHIRILLITSDSKVKRFLTKKALLRDAGEGLDKIRVLLGILELVDGVEGYGDGVAVVVANQAVKVAFQGVIPADF